jgi:hypothetical protein
MALSLVTPPHPMRYWSTIHGQRNINSLSPISWTLIDCEEVITSSCHS